MFRISQVKLPVTHTEEELEKKLLHTLRIERSQMLSWSIWRQSLDARKKPELYYVYTLDAEVKNEVTVYQKLKKKHQDKNIVCFQKQEYCFPDTDRDGEYLTERPYVIGCGPAGIFCAYFLAEAGYRPVLVEQGAPVEERQQDVEAFWKTGVLNPDSNVQFGEGGAGAFSDGKLNTLVKDPGNRIHKVMEVFVEHGAPKEILYVNKPHIGTDILCDVIKSMRMKILEMGGDVQFHTRMERLLFDENGTKINGLELKNLRSGELQNVPAEVVILAPGHSARETFYQLYGQKIPMEPKSFAVGFRAEHRQELINRSQYGEGYPESLGAAAYKLTAKLPDGRGVYTFCMCPGGYVVNASSEEGMLAVNGMSYHDRASRNANSAVIVTVFPKDFESEHPLAGIAFQRKLERAAYEAGNGKIPVQRYGDFYEEVVGLKKEESADSEFAPCMKGMYQYTSLKGILPAKLNKALIGGIEEFGRKIKGYSSAETLLSAVESRTSSPVRIIRDEKMESEISGLYPCGEGAGYAGGITSAAVDGIKVAEVIRKKFHSFDKVQ